MVYKSLKEICEIAKEAGIPFWKVIQRDDCTERNVEESDSFEQMRAARGYDHHYFIDGEGMRPFARAYAEDTGILMEVESDMPGMQLYSGNYLEKLPVGKNQSVYTVRSGFCVETQYAPNAVHCPVFTSPILHRGERYEHTTIYRFSNQ